MALKSYNPTTPSQRQLVIVDRSSLHRGDPVKTLTEGKLSTGGRNNNGRITVRFRGGGHKKAYRLVHFKHDQSAGAAVVGRLAGEPERPAVIPLGEDADPQAGHLPAPPAHPPGADV